jgi:hypothetical protein
MKREEINKKTILLLAILQLAVESIEELEKETEFWQGGHLKKRAEFFKIELDKRLNVFMQGTEEQQLETIAVINEAETVLKEIYDQI